MYVIKIPTQFMYFLLLILNIFYYKRWIIRNPVVNREKGQFHNSFRLEALRLRTLMKKINQTKLGLTWYLVESNHQEIITMI